MQEKQPKHAQNMWNLKTNEKPPGVRPMKCAKLLLKKNVVILINIQNTIWSVCT